MTQDVSRRQQIQSHAAQAKTENEKDDELWADMRAGLCSFCQRPVTIADFVELATLRDGKLSYPSHHRYGGEPIAYLTHKDCSPINGYWLPLENLSVAYLEGGFSQSEGPGRGLLWHIEQKLWRSWAYERGLRLAANLAEKLQTRKRNGDGESRRTTRVQPSPSLRARVFERDSFRCRRCGHGPPEVKLVLDHIVAVANGGETSFKNLQALCQPCNAGKAARAPTARDLQ